MVNAQSITIKTTTIIDGKGQVLRNKEIVVENGKIARIDAASHKPDIDLSGLTVTPGWIDTHAHPGWYFDKDGRYDPGGRNSKTTPQEGALLDRLLTKLQAGASRLEQDSQSPPAAVNS